VLASDEISKDDSIQSGDSDGRTRILRRADLGELMRHGFRSNRRFTTVCRTAGRPAFFKVEKPVNAPPLTALVSGEPGWSKPGFDCE